MIDGSSRHNPGKSGIGFWYVIWKIYINQNYSFFGRQNHNLANQIEDETQTVVDITSESVSGFGNILDIFAQQRREQIKSQFTEKILHQVSEEISEKLTEREFMFGMCANLGVSTNNYAEYCALIYTLILCNILGLKQITIYSDSKLIVDQVKGNIKIRHPVFKEIIKKVHQIILWYEEIDLNFIEREYNTAADKFAKEGTDMDEEYKYVFSLLDVVSSIKLM